MKKSTLILVFSLFTKLLFASVHSAPPWTVNPNDYQYSMSVVATLSLNCTDLSDDNNKVGAFVNGECRGVVKTNNNLNGKKLAYLIIYSNLTSGETIELRYYNVATDSVYVAKENLTFSDNAAVGTNNRPYLVRNNDAPTNIELSTYLMLENITVGTQVATVSVTDPDVNDKHVLSFVPDPIGGADNSFFIFSGNKLKVFNPINTSLKDTFKLRIRATDNFGCAFDKKISLIVDKVNDAPTGLSLSDSTFFENESGPIIGFFIPTDQDLIDHFKYSFTSGIGDVDNAKFLISDTVLVFKASANYEVKKTYSIRCRVTDIGGLTFDQVFTIYVKDKNDPPTNILLGNTKVYENEPANQLVAKISTVDEDTWDKYEYIFANIGTNDNTSFQIVNDSLKAKKVFDFETKDSYVIYLTSTDSSGVSITKSFTITIKDTLDAPTDLRFSNALILENSPKGTFVGKLSTVEAKSAIPLHYTFTLVAGDGSIDNSRFYISNDTVYNNEMFNYERNKQFSIRTRAALINGMNIEKEFIITVKDVSASNITINNTKVFENEPIDQFVAKITTVSTDLEKRYEYTFGNIGTNDNSSFSISNDTLRANKVFDFEGKNSYIIYLTSTDSSGVSISRIFTIYVKDGLDVPTDILISNNALKENAPAKTFVGVLSTVDANLPGPNVYVYSLVTGKGSTDNASFFVSNDSLYSNEAFDFEVKKNYNIRAKTTLVNGMFTEKEFSISVIDIPSTNIVLSNTKVFENEPATQFVAKISTTSLDLNDVYQYSFGNIGTNDNTSFTISNDTLRANKIFDFETKSSYTVYLVSTSLSGASITRPFTISIKDTLDVPTDLLLDNSIITENLPKNTFIGKLSTVDANLPGPVIYNYTAVSGAGSTDNGSFRISNDSVYSNQVFDFEKKISYNIRVKSTLVNGMYIEKAFTISIKDIPSTNIALNNTKVFENEPTNQFVAKISTISLDTNDTYSYSFGNIGTNDNTSFIISNDTLKANKVFDFETKNSYIVYLVSTSLSGASITRPFNILIKDTLDVPTDLILDNNVIIENLPKNTFIGRLSTIDANQQPVIYKYTTTAGIGSTDNSNFIISNDSVYSNRVFDFEKKASYTIRVRSTLVNGMHVEKAFTISIKDIPSTDIALSNMKVYENEPFTQFVAKISTISLDTNDTYSYTFGNVGTNDNTSFTISNDTLKANRLFDFETKNSYVVYLVSTSLSNLSITRPFTILIKDTLDMPTDLALDNTSILENTPANTFLGKLSTIDANRQPVIYKYTTVAGIGSIDNDTFRISNDSVYINKAFDFEKRTSYTIRVRSTLVNNMYVEKAFDINVLNANEVPTALSISKDSIPENTSDSTYVGTFSTVDEDNGEAFVYTLVSGANDSGNKAFIFKGGNLLLVKPADYETASIYSIRVRTTDKGGLFLEKVFSIYIKDVNEQPHIPGQAYEILELAEQRTELGIVKVEDVDQNQTQKLELLTSGIPFSIDAASGMLTLTGAIDYEKRKQYDVWVRTTDSGNPSLSDSIQIRIMVLDEIEDDNLPSADLVSPNGDEKNDTWKITNVELYKDYSLDILDENGQSVYSVPNNYANNWDAKRNGTPLPSGIYYYIFKGNVDNKLFKGYITVVK